MVKENRSRSSAILDTILFYVAWRLEKSICNRVVSFKPLRDRVEKKCAGDQQPARFVTALFQPLPGLTPFLEQNVEDCNVHFAVNTRNISSFDLLRNGEDERRAENSTRWPIRF